MAASGLNTCTEIEMEPLTSCCDREHNESPPRHNIRSHTRSQSWTNMEPDTRPRFAPNLTSIYSISPLTTMFREFLARSGDRTANHVPNSHHNNLNRTFSESTIPQQSLNEARGNTPPPQGRSQSRSVSSTSLDRMDIGEGEEGFRDNLEQPTIVEISEGINWLERNAAFLVIILLKFVVFHRTGISLILAMMVTFYHCNHVIRQQVALRTRRQPFILIITLLFLAGNISIVYYTFWDKHIYNCLYFRPPQFKLDIVSVIWSIWVTDFIVRFATMGLKALVAALYVRFLSNKKKRIVYMLLEYFSQLYRTAIPTPLWVQYLSDKQPSGFVIAVVITSTYLMIKGVIMFLSIRDVYRAVVSLIKYRLYDRVQCRDRLLESGNSLCPICQEDFHKPVSLKCTHVFCEDCVLQWLDRQSSCPLCRAAIPNHNPRWRDGSTSTWPQLF